MLNKEQVKHKIEHDSEFMRQLAIKFLGLGMMKGVEAHFNIEVGILDDLFYEIPHYQRMFDDELDKQFQKQLAREGYINMLRVSKRLAEVTNDSTMSADGGPTIKDVISAASTLAKIHESVLRKKGDSKKDELDELWETVNEPKSEEGISSMPET